MADMQTAGVAVAMGRWLRLDEDDDGLGALFHLLGRRPGYSANEATHAAALQAAWHRACCSGLGCLQTC